MATSTRAPRASSKTISVPGYRIDCYGVQIVRVLDPHFTRFGAIEAVPAEFEPAESPAARECSLSLTTAREKVRTYNCQARSKRWSTWAIVVTAPAFMSFLKAVEQARVKRHRGVLDELDHDHPELNLNGSQWASDEGKFHLSVSVDFTMYLDRSDEDFSDLRQRVLAEARRQVAILREFADANCEPPKLRVLKHEGIGSILGRRKKGGAK
jgi:hypothetical protein